MRTRILALAATAVLLGCTSALCGAPPDPEAAAWAACEKQVEAHKFRSDYDAARRSLRAFMAAFPASTRAAAARKKMAGLEEFAEKQIKALQANARAFSGRRRFDLALEIYTEIITRAPSPEWLKKAREGIERNDKATAPLHAAVKKKFDQLFKQWKFAEAAKLAGKTGGDLAGTKWAEPTSRMLMEAAGAREFFASLAAKVKKSKDKPRKTPFKVKDLSGWYVRGKIVKADATGFICTVSGAGKTYTWAELLPKKAGEHPKKLLEILDLYALDASEQLALGILLFRRGFKKAGVARLKIARKRQELSEEASYYLDLISGNLNRAAYDFSSGLQLMDWRAGGGRWRIVKGQLVQEAASGEGQLTLSRHEYNSKEVRFFFEMSTKSSKGLVSVVFVQDAKNSFGFVFSPADGYSAFAVIGEEKRSVKDEKFRLPRGKKVRIRCGVKGDAFALSVGKKKLPRLTLPGLGKLKGHFRLRTFDSQTRFDNIVIRNLKE